MRKQEKFRIGIVGCGAIAKEIVTLSAERLKEKLGFTAFFDIDKKRSEELARLSPRGKVANSLDEVFDTSDLIIECASSAVSPEVVKRAIDNKKAVLVMSVGGLIESSALLEEARKKNIKVFFPSGAICGLDGLKAAKVSQIKKVTLRTRKPPLGLIGAPYLKKNNIDLGAIKDEKVIFKGSAIEAVKGFPKNVNVASLLSLAGIGPNKTTVEIIVSPKYTKNVHEIEIIGDSGRITTRTENVPSESNPKTSRLAALSAIATLEGIADSVRVGT